MIKYIGDISKADAALLKVQASLPHYKSILEFGCGASTQVIAKYKDKETKFVSIDTSKEWIDKTVDNLQYLGINPDIVEFCEYNLYMPLLPTIGDKFDFVFDDGVDSHRREFAIRVWPYIKVGGALGFHDTRRAHDFRNVLETLANFQNEIGAVIFNANDSNITLVYKIAPRPYDNWQISENRQPFELGYGDIPEDYKKLMKESE